MSDTRKRRYVRINTESDELFQDLDLFAEEADRLNEKLAADGSKFRWMPYGAEEEVSAA